MGWWIVVALIVGPILICIWGMVKEESKPSTWTLPETRSYTSSGSSSYTSTTALRSERLSDQTLWQCYARFSGAICDARRDGVWRSSIQRASIQVNKEDGGKYTFSSSYHHDASYELYEALRRHGDLHWMGMRVGDDSFYYGLSNVKGEEYAYSPQFLIKIVINENPDAYVAEVYEYDNSFYVEFKFH